ncbi:hypothetical protein BB561_001964 [Smittium simulii]|uniref:Beta-adaptin appendage C-terminal subdomain domain-containing protein n=1 Tax=Smittium simulii TaxID=133385 RepID=A0A2T9YSE7_9FUNG|nr:hypothetical protein BB561_001964 [Smittium simulii]
MKYVPQTTPDAIDIIERIKPRFLHNNSSVILSSIRLVAYLMNYIDDKSYLESLCKQITNPLVVLLNFGAQVQLVTLKSIQLLYERWPLTIQGQLQSFFCKYRDPIYIKVEKLKLLVILADEDTAALLLMELEEYSLENNEEFVSKVIDAIGTLSIKFAKSSSLGVSILMSLLKKKSSLVANLIFTTMQNIFVRYPNRYKKYLTFMFLYEPNVTDPDAQSSLIWLAGTYLNTIKNFEAIIYKYANNFSKYSPKVQSAILISLAKFYIAKPSILDGIITDVLTAATNESTDPDIRDRAFFYWRLFSLSPTNAKAIVFSNAQSVSRIFDPIETDKLDNLLLQLSTLSSVIYDQNHKPIKENNKKFLKPSPALAKIRFPFPTPTYFNNDEQISDPSKVHKTSSPSNSPNSDQQNLKRYDSFEDNEVRDVVVSKSGEDCISPIHFGASTLPSPDKLSDESLNQDPYLALADYPLGDDANEPLPGSFYPWAQSITPNVNNSSQANTLHKVFSKTFQTYGLTQDPHSAEQLAEETFANTISKYNSNYQTPIYYTTNVSNNFNFTDNNMFSDLNPLNNSKPTVLSKSTTTPLTANTNSNAYQFSNNQAYPGRSQSIAEIKNTSFTENGLTSLDPLANTFGKMGINNNHLSNDQTKNLLTSVTQPSNLTLANKPSNFSLLSQQGLYQSLPLNQQQNNNSILASASNEIPPTPGVGLGVTLGTKDQFNSSVQASNAQPSMGNNNSFKQINTSNDKNHLSTTKNSSMDLYNNFEHAQNNTTLPGSLQSKLLDSQQSNGLEIYGAFERLKEEVSLVLTCSNLSTIQITEFALQLNLNTFGIVPGSPMSIPNDCLNPGDKACIKIPLIIGESTMIQQITPINNLQMAIKCSLGIFYFQTTFSLHILLLDEKHGKLEQNDFLKNWYELTQPNQSVISFENKILDLTDIRNKLSMNNIFTIAQRKTDQFYVFFTSSKLFDQTVFVTEIKFTLDLKFAQVVSKSINTLYLTSHCEAIKGILVA